MVQPGNETSIVQTPSSSEAGNLTDGAALFTLIRQGVGKARVLFSHAELIEASVTPWGSHPASLSARFTNVKLYLDDFQGDKISIQTLSDNPDPNWSIPVRDTPRRLKYDEPFTLDEFRYPLDKALSKAGAAGVPAPWKIVSLFKPYLDERFAAGQVYYRVVNGRSLCREIGTATNAVYQCHQRSLDSDTVFEPSLNATS